VATELSDLDKAIRHGDQTGFVAIVERHRRELQVHCYRMIGLLHDAEDMVQETFMRAWSKRSTYEGRAVPGEESYERLAIDVPASKMGR
jgi:RNA polymerase sigma-70 factor (ECF subfamily)